MKKYCKLIFISLVLGVASSAAHAAPLTDAQYREAKTQLNKLMFMEDLKDYEKKVSMDRNGVITVINYSGKRLRGTANNLFVAFNSNNIFMANMVYYGFVWDNKFDLFDNSMIYARQFKTMTVGKNWARHIIKETAKLAAMTGHSNDPLTEQKITYLKEGIRSFEAGDSRNRTVRKWYGQVVLPALREAISGGGATGGGSRPSGGGTVAAQSGQKLHKVKCIVYCNPRHGQIRFKMKATSRKAAERRLKNKGLTSICKSAGYRSVGGGMMSDGIGCSWD